MRAATLATPGRALALLLALSLLACDDARAPTAKPAGRTLALVEASAGADLTSLVAAEVARGAHDQVAVLVYVGASWCEPCVRFHDAARAGRLDAELPDLRVIVFDADRDDAALIAAGYRSQMIPLFSEAGPDGRAGTHRMEGGIKGDGAVAQLAARLRDLLTAIKAR